MVDEKKKKIKENEEEELLSGRRRKTVWCATLLLRKNEPHRLTLFSIDLQWFLVIHSHIKAKQPGPLLLTLKTKSIIFSKRNLKIISNSHFFIGLNDLYSGNTALVDIH